MNYFSEYYPKLTGIADDLFKNPELGYKEFHTSQTVETEILQIYPKANINHFSGTGLRVDFKNGSNKTIAIIAELDSLYQPGHFAANPETGAAQACGHFTQVTTALSIINTLVKSNSINNFGANLAFIFTPAEEYVDLSYRKQLKKEGKISFFGGKQEAIKLGIFDDIDYCISTHAIGEDFDKRTVEIDCNLAGFNFEYFDFRGKASHAGFAPEAGINVENIANLFTTALAYLRQSVKNPNQIRYNPVMISQNEMSINVIPEHIQMGTDLRYFDHNYALELQNKFINAATGCAHALGGKVEIEKQIGYLPLIQSESMNQRVKTVFANTPEIEDIIENRGYVMAAGDIGDISFLMPTIQIGYGGFTGTIHGKDFKLVDKDFVLQIFPEFVYNSILDISNHLSAIKSYRKTRDQYLTTLSKMEN